MVDKLVEQVFNNYYVNSECPYGDGESWKKILQVMNDLSI